MTLNSKNIVAALRFLLMASLSVFCCDAMCAERAPEEIAQYLKSQGPIVKGRIYCAELPREQIVVYYCVDENLKGGKSEGASNPANAGCEIALFNKTQNWVFADRLNLGQGNVRTFKNGSLIVESVDYQNGDPLCCPSMKRKFAITTSDGRLVRKQK
jgi:hypothetical protein